MALFAALSAPAQAQAEVTAWISPLTGNWDNPTNWNSGFVPTAADDAVFNNDGIALVTTSSDTARSLFLGQSGSAGLVSILAGGLLTTTGGSNVIGSTNAGVLSLSAEGEYNFGGASPALVLGLGPTGSGAVTIDARRLSPVWNGDVVIANQGTSRGDPRPDQRWGIRGRQSYSRQQHRHGNRHPECSKRKPGHSYWRP